MNIQIEAIGFHNANQRTLDILIRNGGHYSIASSMEEVNDIFTQLAQNAPSDPIPTTDTDFIYPQLSDHSQSFQLPTQLSVYDSNLQDQYVLLDGQISQLDQEQNTLQFSNLQSPLLINDPNSNVKWIKKDFLLLRRIGQGGQGIVRVVKEKQSGKLMARKEMNYQTPKEIEMVNSEVTIIREMHKFFRTSSSSQNSFIPVIEPLGFFVDEDEFKAFLIMEYCEGGDLHKYIKDMKKSKSQISEEDAWNFISQIVLSIYQLHSHKIIHGDLKTSNVLLTRDRKIKLRDFGLARKLQNVATYATANGFTWQFLAPELLQQSQQQRIKGLKQKLELRFSLDIWALGIILFELLSLEHPFMNKGEDQDLPLLENFKQITENEPKQLPLRYPENMRNLILRMLVKDPSQRITANQIMLTPEINANLNKK
ncbi:MAG: putative MAP kinase kinase family domain protein [Streblomastix strix]|uniref:non-specific serine/threonine protein kinase n=1 Tax=Streblomastix strix TaxID=222440 RepID=A0A5J4W8I4_9EUKA|nr:MAG: putative MAP kinase kinase family domain protein [Streblomastix strix]